MSTGCLCSPYTFPGRVGGLLRRVDRLGGGAGEGVLLEAGRVGDGVWGLAEVLGLGCGGTPLYRGSGVSSGASRGTPGCILLNGGVGRPGIAPKPCLGFGGGGTGGARDGGGFGAGCL